MRLTGITLITTCTNRKRVPVPVELAASSLPEGPQFAVLKEWCCRLSSAIPAGPASKMYCGRGFAEACHARSEVSGSLLIISAGLGLVSEDTQIPSYSLTVTASGSDSILKKIIGQAVSLSEWWRDLNLLNGSPAPISQLISRHPNRLFVIALSRAYANLIQRDLLCLQDTDLRRVRLVGLSLHPALDVTLHGLIMPYDERLDELGNPFAGTRSDFSQRAMRHFVNEVVRELPDGDLNDHAGIVSQLLSGARLRTIPKRKTLPDQEIMQLIRKDWDLAAGSSSKMLRIIRDHEAVACEQGRFRRLFSLVKQEVSS